MVPDWSASREWTASSALDTDGSLQRGRIAAMDDLTTRSPRSRSLRVALASIGWFNLVSALVGMVGLTLGGGMGIPLEWIEGTVFSSYFWPGIILGVIVGGSQALAILAQHRGYALAWGLHAAAGIVMMIWIFVEIAIMLVWSPLHGIYFVTGTLQTALAVLALGAWPSPFLRRGD